MVVGSVDGMAFLSVLSPEGYRVLVAGRAGARWFYLPHDSVFYYDGYGEPRPRPLWVTNVEATPNMSPQSIDGETYSPLLQYIQVSLLYFRDTGFAQSQGWKIFRRRPRYLIGPQRS